MQTVDLSKLEGFRFIAYVGSEEAKTACLMSATAYLAGEPWGDHPECACPVLRSVGISLNDGPWWADDDERGEFVRQYAPLLIGTRSTPDVERKRANLLVRAALAVFAPSALDSAASALRLRGLNDHADKLADFAQQLRSDPSAELAREARRAAYAANAYAANAYAANADAAANAANAANAAYAAAAAAANAANAANAADADAAAAANAANAANAADADAAAANAANAANAADAAANAADAAAKSSFVEQKARAEARRGVRDVLLKFFDEAIAITEATTP